MKKNKLFENVQQMKLDSAELMDNLKLLTDLYDRPNPYKNYYSDIKGTMDKLLSQLDDMEKYLKKDVQKD